MKKSKPKILHMYNHKVKDTKKKLNIDHHDKNEEVRTLKTNKLFFIANQNSEVNSSITISKDLQFKTQDRILEELEKTEENFEDSSDIIS